MIKPLNVDMFAANDESWTVIPLVDRMTESEERRRKEKTRLRIDLLVRDPRTAIS